MVGVIGLEPTTLCSQSRCASQLRHTPISLMGLQRYCFFFNTLRRRCDFFALTPATAQGTHTGPQELVLNVPNQVGRERHNVEVALPVDVIEVVIRLLCGMIAFEKGLVVGNSGSKREAVDIDSKG